MLFQVTREKSFTNVIKYLKQSFELTWHRPQTS